jgi:hypothetical protein
VSPDSGVTSLDKVLPTLRAMADAGVLLLVHGEVTDSEVDMFDREAVFIHTKLVSECVFGWLVYISQVSSRSSLQALQTDTHRQQRCLNDQVRTQRWLCVVVCVWGGGESRAGGGLFCCSTEHPGAAEYSGMGMLLPI